MLLTLNSPEAESYRRQIRDWLNKSVPEPWLNRSQEMLSSDEELDLKRNWGYSLYEAGYAGLTWPTVFGGQGLGPIEEFIFYEESAKAGAPESLDTLGKYLAGPAIMQYGTDGQKVRFLPPILAGREIWCEGYSEPDGGSDLASASTTALRGRDEDDYLVNGHKIWTSWGHIADRCYLLAKTSRELPHHHNLSVFLFNMRQPNVEVRRIRQITGDATFNEVTFENALATRDELLGVENGGWSLVGLTGPYRRIRFALNGLRQYGQLYALIEQLSNCTRESHLESIANSFQDRLETFRWHLMRLVELQANDREWYGPAAILRLTFSELAQEVTEVGLTAQCTEHDDYWRDRFLHCRSETIAGGTSEIQRNVIATSVLKMPRFGQVVRSPTLDSKSSGE